jgi:hypothetical protein
LQVLDGDWWRVEVQWRPSTFDETLPASLFDGLSVTLLNADGLSFAELAMLRFLQEDPAALMRIPDWSNRKRTQAKLENRGSALTPSPADVYRSDRSRLLCELAAIEFGARGGVTDAPEQSQEVAESTGEASGQEPFEW